MNGNRATSWRLRTRTLDFGRLPRLMGIVNVTPDSFSDGGHFFESKLAIAHALRLLDRSQAEIEEGVIRARGASESMSAHIMTERRS